MKLEQKDIDSLIKNKEDHEKFTDKFMELIYKYQEYHDNITEITEAESVENESDEVRVEVVVEAIPDLKHMFSYRDKYDECKYNERECDLIILESLSFFNGVLQFFLVQKSNPVYKILDNDVTFYGPFILYQYAYTGKVMQNELALVLANHMIMESIKVPTRLPVM